MSDSSTSSTSSSQLGDVLVDFHVIKTWIAAKEADQASTNQPASLTPTQKKNIEELKKSILSDGPTVDPKEVFDKDYLGILNNYLAVSQGSGTSITYPEPLKRTTQGWTQTVALLLTPTSPPMVFPSRKTGGLIADITGHPSLPTFGRKKDAKRYAAKLCVDWLVSQGHLVPNLADEKGWPFVVPEALKPKTKGVRTGVVDPHDASVPATQRLAQLCNQMGFQSPTFRITPWAGQAGGALWDGEVDFGADSGRFPEGVGRVEKVYNKAKAKEMVAEALLEFLLKEEEKREKIKRMVELMDN